MRAIRAETAFDRPIPQMFLATAAQFLVAKVPESGLLSTH
jgi:hypothetical protein